MAEIGEFSFLALLIMAILAAPMFCDWALHSAIRTIGLIYS
jgi:hypothetical protein